MDRNTFRQRLRQILATDRNALGLYIDLAGRVRDQSLKDEFLRLAKDEEHHVSQVQEMLALLDSLERRG